MRREGTKVILEPVVERPNEWSPEFLAVLGSLKDEEIPRPRQQPISKAKNPFRKR